MAVKFMEYNIDVYEIDETNKYRFALGSLSEKTLFVFGVNPSTADDKKPDNTIKKVMGFAEKNGYKSFMMLNLYPQRATNPNKLSNEIDRMMMNKNLEVILHLLSLKKEADILLAWGGLIFSRSYLPLCLKEIYQSIKDYSLNFYRIGDFLKSGQPRHPLYAGYKQEFQVVDMDKYLQEFNI
ncbi:hypothetical protein EDC45_1472 [Mesocricetibacter intestinalis]|uniref:DUF1643 domain-containing protein n=1 Tax=Mesocricetibacter intestinalis TaxID=1521930 RepID=A0A4R6VBA3_9PAST|nr:DUF1643 domain-containing protein [Mesocricetibacter intestinalis]TDQ57411.1 hypothetical protein EDC45_1472 [Mesocricetibacter intestinalis]